MTDPALDTKPDRQPESFDEIRADRACIGCGFNLYAQPVTKEEHYGLAICRCPECGTVAALQQYPMMTHWVNRFRTLIAAVWIVLLLGLFIGSTMAITGLSQGASNIAGENMSDIIGQAHYEWSQEQDRLRELANPSNTAGTSTSATTPALTPGTTIVTSNGVTTINGVVTPLTTTTTTTQPGRFNWVWLSPGWGDAHLDRVIKDNGGLIANIDREFLVMLIPGTIVGTLFGIFWSIALLGGTRRKAAIVPVVSCALAVILLIGMSRPDYNFTYISALSQDLYSTVIGPVFIAYMLFVSMIGIWIGRKFARLVVVMALPARGRVPLSLLWTRDGLELPRP